MSKPSEPVRAPAMHGPAAFSQLLVPPYGAPTATSEVSKLIGFYSVAGLMVFAGAHVAPEQDRRELPIAA